MNPVDELEARVRTLKDAISRYDLNTNAAEFFRDAASRGDDIGRAIPALIQAYLDSHNIGIMQPIADAIVIHSLRAGDLKRLQALLKREAFTDYIINGLRNAAGRRIDIGPAVPFLLKLARGGGARHAAVEAVKAWFRKDPARLARATALIARHHRAFLVPLFKDVLLPYQGFDLASAMGEIQPLLGSRSESVRAQAAFICSLAAEVRVDLGGVRTALEKATKDASEDVARKAAYALALDAVRKGEPLDAIEQHGRLVVREEVIHALCVALFQTPDRRMASRVARLLLDRDPETRRRAAQGLQSAAEREIQFVADGPTMDALARAADRWPEIVEYLFRVIESEPGRAPQILQALPESEVTARLAQLCRQASQRQDLAPCSICRHLARRQNGSHMSDMPRQLSDLEVHGSYRVCPECRSCYEYEYESEWDDMSYCESISLRRLSPSEAVRKTRDDYQAWLKAHYEEVMAGLIRDLDHPLHARRVEAAWALTEHYLAEEQWKNLADLLGYPAPEVRLAAVRTLDENRPSQDLSVIEDALTELLTDVTEAARGAASAVLARLWLRRRDHPSILSLIATPDSGIQTAAVYALDAVARDGYDISDFIPALQSLVAHSKGEVRTPVEWALSHAPCREEHVSSTVDAWRRQLSNADARIRCDAVDALRNLGADGVDMVEAIPQLAELLADEAVAWHANDALKTAVSQGCDIRVAIPFLIEGVRARSRHSADFIWTLSQAADRGSDILASLPVLAERLQDRGPPREAARTVLSRLSEKGVDIEEIEPQVRKAMGTDESYWREQYAYMLTRHYVRRGEWECVRALFRRRHPKIRQAVCFELENLHRRGMDITPMVPAIRNLRESSDANVKRGAESLLGACGDVEPKRRKRGGKAATGEASSTEAAASAGAVAPATAVPPPEAAAPAGAVAPATAVPPPEAAARVPSVEIFGLEFIPMADLDPPVLVGLFGLFDGPRHVPDVYREIEAFNKAHGSNLRLISHRAADHLLNRTTGWKGVEGYCPFITDAILAYEMPGLELGEEIIFAFEDCTDVAISTGGARGHRGVALLVQGLQAADFHESAKRITLTVSHDRLTIIDPFPDEGGWCMPDPASGVPTGWPNLAADEARRLHRRTDGPYVGPLGRGIHFGGSDLDGRRCVLAGNLAIRDRYGILVEMPLKT